MSGVKAIKSPTVDRAPPKTRAAVSNGTRLHPEGEVDGRTVAARRFKDLVGEFSAGFEHPSVAEQALIRSAATLIVESEKLQARAIAGEQIDHEQLTRLANSAVRTLGQLGLKRGREVEAKPHQGLAEIISRHGGGP